MREGQVLGAINEGMRGAAQAQGYGDKGYQDVGEKQSPVDAALDRLAKMVECARMDLNELHARLAPVSQPVPMEAAKEKSTSQATCRIEERISDITNCVVAIGNDLRAARQGLCI